MDRVSLLARIPLFEELTQEELAALAERFTETRVPGGTEIFRAGADGEALFLIQDGAIEISRGDARARTTLSTLFPGQLFGELSLFDGSPRSATATATRDSILLALSREDFTRFLRTRPDATLKIMAELAERIRATNELFSSQVSRDVLEEAEERLAFGQRVADHVAKFGGSWTFIGVFGALMTAWMALNMWLPERQAFDPFPFILLNLALSTTAALQAPVIMMSQNRQSAKDKLLAQNDYLVNLKAELGIQQMLKNQAEVLQRLTLMERGLLRTATPQTLHTSHARPSEGERS